MFQRAAEVVLTIAIVIGVIFFWRTNSERDSLQQEHDRLAKKVGPLTVTDETKVHLRAIDTGVPGSFAWRAYFPANYSFQYSSHGGGGGSSSFSDAREGILRVRIREVDGQMMMYTRFLGGSGMQTCDPDVQRAWKKDREFLKLLKVDQLGTEGVVVLEPTEQLPIIKLVLPKELVVPTKKDQPAEDIVIEHVRIGPPRSTP